MVGLIFPHLKDSFPFTSMPDVTLVLDDWTLEQFWLEVSSALGEKEAKSQEYAGKTLDLERGIEASSISNIEYEEIEEYGNKTGTGNYDDEEERFASGISLELDMLVDEEIKEIDTKNREIFRLEHQAYPETYSDEDKIPLDYENDVKSEPDVKATEDESKYSHDYFEEYFPGNNNSPVSMKPPLNLCAKAKEDPKEKTQIYKCEACEQNFKTEIKLTMHMQLYHLVDKPVKCKFKGCNVESINIEQRKAHIEQFHAERVPCDVCGKSVRTTSLKAHQQTHVTSNKTFPCEVCDYKTSLRGNLDIHMKKHSDKKNYQCTNCEKKFTWCSSLKSHMLAAHSKKSHKFKCEICTHEFKDGSNLAQHMFTHRVERPHNCNKCGKGWIRADFLKNHKCSAL